MKISRHILRFASGGLLAAVGYVGYAAIFPEKGLGDIPLWQVLGLVACMAIFVIGVGNMLASFISWIIAGVSARRKAKHSAGIH